MLSLELCVFANFVITLTLFPSITGNVFMNSDPNSKYFVPVYCFVGYNLGDYIGSCTYVVPLSSLCQTGASGTALRICERCLLVPVCS